MRTQLVFLAACMLSLTTSAYGVMFSFQLAGALLAGVLLSCMTISFNILEFSTAYYLRIFAVERKLLLVLVCVLVILSGIAFSVLANTWVIAGEYADYKSDRIAQSDEYEAWRMRRDAIQKQISDIQDMGVDLPGIESNIRNIESEISSLLNQRAINSRGRYSGQSVGGITGNCSNSGYYYNTYCSGYQGLVSELEQLKASQEHVSKLPVYQKQIADLLESPPIYTDSEAPAVVSLGKVLDIDPGMITPFLHLFLAIFNELGAIFAWSLLSIQNEKQTLGGDFRVVNEGRKIVDSLISKESKSTDLAISDGDKKKRSAL